MAGQGSRHQARDQAPSRRPATRQGRLARALAVRQWAAVGRPARSGLRCWRDAAPWWRAVACTRCRQCLARSGGCALLP